MITNNTRDLAGLRLFVRVAESGSFSKVAQALDTTQPVISRRIAAVEKAWGGRLLHRTGRGVMLTEMGERALPKVRELLAQADLLAEQISRTKTSPSGVVRIATLPSVAYLIVPPLLRHIRQRQLDIRIEIVEGSSGQVEALHAEDRSDLSILYRHGPLQPHETKFATVHFCLIGRPDDPLLDAQSIPFRRLHGLPLALPPRPDTSRRTIEQVFRRLGIDFNVVIEVASLPLLALVAEQQGHYTTLPRFTVAQAVESGRLKAVQLVDPSLFAIIAAGQPLHRPLSAAAGEIFTFIQGVVRQAIPS